MSSEYEYDQVWQLFKRFDDEATCLKCNKIITCKSSSTSGLHRHMERIHNMKRREHEAPKEQPPAKKTRTLHNFFNTSSSPESLEQIVAKLAAKDGIPINAITKSEFIRNSISRLGFHLPKCHKAVLGLVMKYCTKIKSDLKIKIENFKSAQRKFSLSIDEWTSVRNRRYMNIHIYYDDGQSDNLGLVRIQESCPAEKVYELVNAKLSDFNIKLQSDIVAITSDGASVMIKFGRLSPAHQQICYNHGIHLAVMEVMYQKRKVANRIYDSDVSDGDDSDDRGSDENENNAASTSFSDINAENASDDEDDNIVFVADKTVTIKSAFEIVKKVRKIVLKFKNSPVRNAILQDYVKEVEKKELFLLLDCKTRWNSLETMLARYICISKHVRKALDTLNLNFMATTDAEEKYCEDIINALKPIRVAVEALSRQNVNLLAADSILKFLFTKLENQHTELGNEFLSSLKKNLTARRSSRLLSAFKYLHDPVNSSSDKSEFFHTCSKTELIKEAENYLVRLFSTSIQEDQAVSSSDDDDVFATNNVDEEDMAKQLEKYVQQCSKPKADIAQHAANQMFSSLRNELKLYEKTGEKTQNVERLIGAFNTVKPTSTQNERNFSTAGNFVSKKRTRLSDEAIDSLCFLKHHFGK